MAKPARAPASEQAAPKGAMAKGRPVCERQVSLKATANDERTAGTAVLHVLCDNNDVPRKPRQKPVLKLKYALAKIRANVEHARKGYRAKLYVEYAECCAVAYRLKQNISEWEEFCRLPFWVQRGTGKPKMLVKHALYLVLIHAVFGLSRSQTKAASKASIALKRFTDDCYEQQTIVDIIKEKGGIENLAKENASPKPTKNLEASEDGSPPAQKTKVSLMGVPLAEIRKHKANTKFRIEAMLIEGAGGTKALKCLSCNKI